jgi:hypothetical protein
MHEETARSRWTSGSRSTSGAMAPRTAVLVLVAATVLVGAVGYMVLSAVASESTSTTNGGGCAPASNPDCAGHTHASAGPGELVAYGPAR